ncbi:MAG: ketoacyl-ACP synthase III [Planctomycetes bacterium]|nr:ketoacyl-ACP synthase III [Planctomycetota bacterium]
MTDPSITPRPRPAGALRRVGIAGLGHYVPERRLTNAELERAVDTSDEWIVQRTGIRERRIAAPGELASEMGARAALEALADAGIGAGAVDLLLCATVTGDYIFPATACEIAHRIGAPQAGGFDIGAACSGFVVGAQTAAQFIATGAYETVLVVGVEKLSAIVDYMDRGTCVIFGDGAGAAVFTTLERAGRGEYLGGSSGMRGGEADALSLPAGGTKSPATFDTVERREHFVRMQGRQIYRFAVTTFVDLVEKALAPYGDDELGLVVPHQVNLRIIESAAEQCGLPMDRVFVNIDRYGNTSAASVPLALYEARAAGRLVPGKLVCCVAFGAGLTWGHVLLRW